MANRIYHSHRVLFADDMEEGQNLLAVGAIVLASACHPHGPQNVVLLAGADRAAQVSCCVCHKPVITLAVERMPTPSCSCSAPHHAVYDVQRTELVLVCFRCYGESRTKVRRRGASDRPRPEDGPASYPAKPAELN